MFVGSVALFEWAEEDRATRRLVVAQARQCQAGDTRAAAAHIVGLLWVTASQGATVKEIRAATGHDPRGSRPAKPTCSN